jgi:type IV pilus assembly protein PilA
MKSSKCSACGFVGWSDGQLCKSCGAILGSGSPSYSDFHDAAGYQGNMKKGLAVCSLVIGIISFMTLGLLGVGAVTGIIVACVALSRINRNPAKYGGRGMAIGGLVLSISSIVMMVPIGIIAAIAIPNLLAARRAANEASSLASMRQIYEAQDAYYQDNQQFGTLDQLATARLIRPELGTGQKNGYIFKVGLSTNEETEQPGFEIVATPVSYPNSGRRSFYLDESGVVRAADARGGEATRFDEPMSFDRDEISGSQPSRRESLEY